MSSAHGMRRLSRVTWIVIGITLVIGVATGAAVAGHTRLYQDWRWYERALQYGSMATGCGLIMSALLAWRDGARFLPVLMFVLALDPLLVALGWRSGFEAWFAGFLFGPLVLTALVFAVVLASRRRDASDPGRRLGPHICGLALAALLQMPVCAALPVLAAHDTRAAMQCCESIALALDAHHATHGEYPADLAVLGSTPLPRLLRERGFYERREEVFSLTVRDRFWGWWVYRSDAREWRYED